MKRIKFLLSASLLIAMSYGGYTAYTNATMTEAERLLNENIEALAKGSNISNKVCIYNGEIYSNGETWYNSDHTILFTCKNGEIIATNVEFEQ